MPARKSAAAAAAAKSLGMCHISLAAAKQPVTIGNPLI
jgi:hypothetical protein